MSEQEELKVGLFDYINAITTTKQNLSELDIEFQKNYNPFMVLRGLSNNVSDVLWANALNVYHGDLSKKQHFDFLFHCLKQGKRYSKWTKEKKDEQVTMVSEFYKVRRDEAEQMIELISPEQLEHIMNHRGGKGSKSKK